MGLTYIGILWLMFWEKATNPKAGNTGRGTSAEAMAVSE